MKTKTFKITVNPEKIIIITFITIVIVSVAYNVIVNGFQPS